MSRPVEPIAPAALDHDINADDRSERCAPKALISNDIPGLADAAQPLEILEDFQFTFISNASRGTLWSKAQAIGAPKTSSPAEAATLGGAMLERALRSGAGLSR
jgi:hypothetical protein